MALGELDREKCPQCGQVGTLVVASREVKGGGWTKKPQRWFWPPRKRREEPAEGETVHEITKYRCTSCAGLAVARRDFATSLEGHKPTPERMSPDDGVFFAIAPHYPEP